MKTPIDRTRDATRGTGAKRPFMRKGPKITGLKPAAGMPTASRRGKPADGGSNESSWSPLETGRELKPSPARSAGGWQRPAADNPDGPGLKARDKDAWKLKSPRRKFRMGTASGGYGKPGAPATDDGLHLLYGIHSVTEALKNPARKFKRLLATENGALRLNEDGLLKIEPVIVKAEEISKRLTEDAVHQGVLLEAEPLKPISLDKIPMDAVVLALDQVTDPHNVGAILRSCAAFNVAALLITERHSPEVTGVLAKAASGALEHVPFASVRNLSDALETLKSRGFTCLGLDSEAEESIGKSDMQRPIVIVMGAEGRGLRQKTRSTCTKLARLDMPGAIKSLNVSNAAAIALYAVTTSMKI